MFKAKVEFILKMINDIEFIINRHTFITNALNDREGQLAILMALMNIGETLNKIDENILKNYNLLEDSKGAYAVRNFIAHDYEGVKLSVIEEILRYNIPILKQKLRKILNHKPIYLCAISNIRSGICNEDCKFCIQSVKHKANILRYEKKEIKEIVNEAKLAKKNRAGGFCLVTSGKDLDDKTLEYVCKAAKAVLKEVDITIIACNGTAEKEKLQELKKAGVKIYNHNLETSREHYPNICTTHSWDERFLTCENIKSVGLWLCCGGIFGIGESKEDINSFINSLKTLKPEGIPVNFFIEHQSLPLKASHNKKYALEIIKQIASEFSESIIMLAGGREKVFGENYIEALKAGANSIVIGDYLTTDGEKPDKDLEYLLKEGFEIADEC